MNFTPSSMMDKSIFIRGLTRPCTSIKLCMRLAWAKLLHTSLKQSAIFCGSALCELLTPNSLRGHTRHYLLSFELWHLPSLNPVKPVDRRSRKHGLPSILISAPKVINVIFADAWQMHGLESYEKPGRKG